MVCWWANCWGGGFFRAVLWCDLNFSLSDSRSLSVSASVFLALSESLSRLVCVALLPFGFVLNVILPLLPRHKFEEFLTPGLPLGVERALLRMQGRLAFAFLAKLPSYVHV